MILEFFKDPILRGPTWGCIWMCISSSLIGVVIFLQKRSLLSETLSHASYPGACMGIALFALFFPGYETFKFLFILLGAFGSSFFALKCVYALEKRKVSSDAALTFTLACFFGLGVLITSILQGISAVWVKEAQTLLFGQAATMQDFHAWIYAGFALSVAFFLKVTFRPLKALLFDPLFARSAQIPVQLVQKVLFILLSFSLVLGIRTVGVVLMSGMVIAPAVAARQFAKHLSSFFFLSALCGALSGFLGNVLSTLYSLPTGPAIVLVASFFAFFSLLFAPRRGLCFRAYRIWAFRLRCLEENLLKAMWKNKAPLTASSFPTKMALFRLQRQGFVLFNRSLSADGKKKAASIVRLHRLWELYLTEELGVHVEKVHRTAEEMEHILTKEMEEKLTKLLENPKRDPHKQPIPERYL